MGPVATSRRYLACAVYAGLAATVVPASAAQSAPIPRVRADSARLGDAIARGTGSSTTFRTLVQSIEATDGIVYLVEGQCGRGVRACLHPNVTAAGPNRVLRIVVNVQRAPGCALVAAIGHELQHAVEILENVHIRTDLQVRNFFDMVGRTSQDRFETEAAMQAGLAVDAEACGAP